MAQEKEMKVSRNGSVFRLFICIAGIYASFLSWAVLQERISTKSYGSDGAIFRGAITINCVQAFCASIIGYFYYCFRLNKPLNSSFRKIIPDIRTFRQFFIVSLTSCIASPFGYASLKHIDFLTLLLGKSLALSVTVGVLMFTLLGEAASKKISSSKGDSSGWGLFLLSISLILDGVMNATQDQIFSTNRKITGPQLMCGLNILSFILLCIYLLSPLTGELSNSIHFAKQYPQVILDIILFGICGATGQTFIFYTLEQFGSLTLVTITVTRKMFSMVLSVLWFGHKLTFGQWAGVLAVFGGISSEAYVKYIEKKTHKKILDQGIKPNTPSGAQTPVTRPTTPVANGASLRKRS